MTHAITIWMLKLVPNGRFGRWLCAGAILLIGLTAYGAAALARFPSFDEYLEFGSWSVAAFFVCAVAYIVPVFHYITSRATRTIQRLAPFLTDADAEQTRSQVERRTVQWSIRTVLLATALWLLQSRILAGSWLTMLESLTNNPYSFLMAIGPLPVWVTMSVAMGALFGNALLFRQLATRLDVEILEPESYMPVGTMAVTSTLVVLGALGLLSIMWLGGPVNWWTTLPALSFFTPLLVLLLLIPVWPLRRILVEQRATAVRDAQLEVRNARRREDDQKSAALAAALVLRREAGRLPTWPFDVPAITRFISYAIIVPLTWAGAALIEMLVDAMLS